MALGLPRVVSDVEKYRDHEITVRGQSRSLKVVSESRVTWATSGPILVFLGLSVLELRPMYTTDRRQTKASLNAPPIRGGRIITELL